MRLTEKDIVQRLRGLTEQYKPLEIVRFEEEVPLEGGARADAIIEFSISNGPSFTALVEFKSVANPKTIREACRQLSSLLAATTNKNFVPIIIAPYISKNQAEILAKESISWLDLSGNMVLQAPNQIYIERTGQKNKFPDTAPIKKIFQGTSSLVSRALLLKPDGFSTLYEVTDFINSRNATITVSTVSKVLKSLEQELLVDKSKSLIRTRDSRKLLDKLTESYVGSKERKAGTTYKYAADNVQNLLRNFSEQQVDYAARGFYAAKLKGLAVTNEITIFVKDIEQVRKASERSLYKVSFDPDAEFGNLIVTETKDPGVWFNIPRQSSNIIAVVDDIELYLEMVNDTPRGPQIADILKKRILQEYDR